MQKQVGKFANPIGHTPSIILVNPRFAYNVSMVVRLASCFGLKQVWFTGDRVNFDLEKKKRLPREERMKGYRDVQICQFDRPFDQFKDATPVAIEVRDQSERLQNFEHPENAVYVFGQEDGSIPDPILRQCHRFVIIPTHQQYCLNLATAVAITLWDRALKLGAVSESEMQVMNYEESKPEEIGLFDTNKTWP